MGVPTQRVECTALRERKFPETESTVSNSTNKLISWLAREMNSIFDETLENHKFWKNLNFNLKTKDIKYL